MEPVVILRGEHVAVGASDLVEWRAVPVGVVAIEQVAAEEREGVEPAELVPVLLETNRGLLPAVAPEKVDHLAVRARGAATDELLDADDGGAHDAAKLAPARHPVPQD